MKSYTNIEQSKKLAEILPITTIDFAWNIFNDGSTRLLRMDDWEVFENAKSNAKIIPCWSLAALLEILDDEITDEDENDYYLSIIKENLQYQLYYHDSWGQVEDIETHFYEDMVDACYEMILKLKEKNLL